MELLIDLTEDEKLLLLDYAERKHVDISALVKQILVQAIEDEHDLRIGEDAIEAYEQDKVSYSICEMKTKYDL